MGTVTYRVLLFLLLTGWAGAEQGFFNNRLALPDLPEFTVLAQDNASKSVNLAESHKRWEVKPVLNLSAKEYLLAHESLPLWVTLSVHHSEYGPQRSLSAQEFYNQFAIHSKKAGIETKNFQQKDTKNLGQIGIFEINFPKNDKYLSKMIYIPAVKETKFPGDNWAFSITVTCDKKTQAVRANKVFDAIVSAGKVKPVKPK